MRVLNVIAVLALLSAVSPALGLPALPDDQEWYSERCEDGNFFRDAWLDITQKEPTLLTLVKNMQKSKYWDAETGTSRIPTDPKLLNCWVRYPIKKRNDREPVVSVDGLRTVILHDVWQREGNSGRYEAGIKIHYELKKQIKRVTFTDASCATYDACGNLVFVQPTRSEEEVVTISRKIQGMVTCLNADMCDRLRILDELKATSPNPEPTPAQPPIPPNPNTPAPIPDDELPKLTGPARRSSPTPTPIPDSDLLKLTGPARHSSPAPTPIPDNELPRVRSPRPKFTRTKITPPDLTPIPDVKRPVIHVSKDHADLIAN